MPKYGYKKVYGFWLRTDSPYLLPPPAEIPEAPPQPEAPNASPGRRRPGRPEAQETPATP